MTTLASPANPSTPERRTQGKQKSGRAARVVDNVLRATAEELALHGYAGLRIEDVALRAGVNKTTIYRRWPTKSVLVSDAIQSHMHSARYTPSTGSLRGDLLDYFSTLLRSTTDSISRGILVTLNSHVDAELDSLATRLRAEARAFRRDIIQQGIARGELPANVDPDIIADIIAGPVLLRVLHSGEDMSLREIETIIDTVLAGAAVNAFRVVTAAQSQPLQNSGQTS